MARVKTPKGKKVKCRATGQFGTTLTFYKAADGKYYQSESVYKNYIQEKESFLNCKRILGALMGFDDTAPYPTFFIKKINEYKTLSFARLEATIRAKENDIRWACTNKKFDTTQRKIQYVFRIISNAINDVQPDKDRYVQAAKEEITIDDYNMSMPLQSSQKVKDMSAFFMEVE